MTDNAMNYATGGRVWYFNSSSQKGKTPIQPRGKPFNPVQLTAMMFPLCSSVILMFAKIMEVIFAHKGVDLSWLVPSLHSPITAQTGFRKDVIFDIYHPVNLAIFAGSGLVIALLFSVMVYTNPTKIKVAALWAVIVVIAILSTSAAVNTLGDLDHLSLSQWMEQRYGFESETRISLMTASDSYPVYETNTGSEAELRLVDNELFLYDSTGKEMPVIAK